MNPKTWREFFLENFDKLLLAALFIYCTLFAVYLMAMHGPGEHVAWGREMCGTILGALLGLITGHALASARSTTITAGGTATSVSTETKP